MEDVAIARAKQTNLYATLTTQVIPANANRVGIILSAAIGETALLYLANRSPIGDVGFSNVLIGVAATPGNAAANTTYISLDMVGSDFLGELLLEAGLGVGAYAAESILNASMPSLAEFQNYPNSPASILAKGHVTS